MAFSLPSSFIIPQRLSSLVCLPSPSIFCFFALGSASSPFFFRFFLPPRCFFFGAAFFGDFVPLLLLLLLLLRLRLRLLLRLLERERLLLRLRLPLRLLDDLLRDRDRLHSKDQTINHDCNFANRKHYFDVTIKQKTFYLEEKGNLFLRRGEPPSLPELLPLPLPTPPTSS